MPPSSPFFLVWGATPDDTSPLFRKRDGFPNEIVGPDAGEFRKSVRFFLEEMFGEKVNFLFSEDDHSPKYGHHNYNAGLYEPQQLEDSVGVVLILPGNRPLAVNTWELALATEHNPLSNPQKSQKLLFVVPETVYKYLGKIISENVTDPKDYRFPKTEDEPILGPQNSFAARWVYLWLSKQFQVSGNWKIPPLCNPFVFYPDNMSWTTEDSNCSRTIRSISGRVEIMLNQHFYET